MEGFFQQTSRAGSLYPAAAAEAPQCPQKLLKEIFKT